MDRDQQVLMERIGGAKLRELAEAHDLTPEGARLVIIREGRRHIERLVLQMWTAQAEGTLLTLAVPAGSDDDQRLAVQYLEWVLGEMSARDDVRVRVVYRPTPDGSFAFALRDLSFKPKEVDR